MSQLPELEYSKQKIYIVMIQTAKKLISKHKIFQGAKFKKIEFSWANFQKLNSKQKIFKVLNFESNFHDSTSKNFEF